MNNTLNESINFKNENNLNRIIDNSYTNKNLFDLNQHDNSSNYSNKQLLNNSRKDIYKNISGSEKKKFFI